MRHLLGVVLVALALINSSCQYWKNNVLFQTTDVQPVDTTSTASDTTEPSLEAVIQPHDVIEIGFSPAEEFFGMATGAGTPQRGEVAVVPYTVDNQGYIQLPLLGKIFVKGMTIGRLRDTIVQILEEGYYKKPYVVVRLASFQINILGEVVRTGPVTIMTDQVTVAEAIALAGGMTMAANKKEVKVIRGDLNENPKVYVFDFTDLSSFKSNPAGYYLQPHDIVYVEPQRINFTVGNIRTILGFATAVNTILIIIQLVRSSN